MFLHQEGFSSSEAFLYKFLSVWDGSLLRPQILDLLSSIPVVPSTREFYFHSVLLSFSPAPCLSVFFLCVYFVLSQSATNKYTMPSPPDLTLHLNAATNTFPHFWAVYCGCAASNNINWKALKLCLFRNWTASVWTSHAALLHFVAVFQGRFFFSQGIMGPKWT